MQMVSELLRHKADPNVPDSEGMTPLFIAAYRGDTQMATELLKYKADPNIPDSEGMTPLSLAKQKNNTAMVVLIEAAIQNLK